MRLSRTTAGMAGTALLGTAILAAAPSAPASAAQPERPHYVALGDSYSSGTGAGRYDLHGLTCQRSERAYPRLWARANDAASAVLAACAGATTATVRSDQLDSLDADTDLVSVTVGGNDAGFARVMETCVLQSTARCEAAIAEARSMMTGPLPGRLDALHAGIRERASNARVVVLGYPRLYTIVDGCPGLGNTKRGALNAAADVLNDVVRAAAVRAGFTFSDVRDEFAGNELCSGRGWLNAVTIPLGDSYHPTALGHERGYLPALTEAARQARVG